MNQKKFSLEDKTVVLVGALGILGSVFTEYLLDAGATLVIADFDKNKCEARAAEMEARFPSKMIGLQVDISDESSVSRFGAALTDRDLIPDVLINNAGHKSKNFFAPLGDFPSADWDEVMGVNVKGIFLTLRALLPKMIARGGGTVISTGSLYGVRGPDKRIYEGSFYEAMGGAINTPMVYAASKGAVSSITRYLATTFGDQGIRANTLVPGGVFSGQNDIFVGKFSNRAPMGRMADSSEIATALVFLASDASSYVTGQDLVVDGGITAW